MAMHKKYTAVDRKNEINIAALPAFKEDTSSNRITLGSVQEQFWFRLRVGGRKRPVDRTTHLNAKRAISPQHTVSGYLKASPLDNSASDVYPTKSTGAFP